MSSGPPKSSGVRKGEDDDWKPYDLSPVPTYTHSPVKFIWQKMKQDPHITAGLGLTLAALSGGLYAVTTGKRHLFLNFMRARVGFQALTAGLVTYGFYRMGDLKKRRYELFPEDEKAKELAEKAKVAQ